MPQQWEYTTLDRVVTTGGTLILRMNGQDIGAREGLHHDRKYPSLFEVINTLGEQGWELAGMDSGQYVFKRQKVEAPQEVEAVAAAPAESENGSGQPDWQDILR